MDENTRVIIGLRLERCHTTKVTKLAKHTKVFRLFHVLRDESLGGPNDS